MLYAVQIHTFYVSIHAPVKGATQVQYNPPFVFLVSIHAPVKGATLCAESIDCSKIKGISADSLDFQNPPYFKGEIYINVFKESALTEGFS